jgi:hypothetical protein
VIGIRSDQANRAHHDHENDSQHHCILRDVLTFLIVPQRSNELLHFVPPVWNTEPGRSRKSATGEREAEEQFQILGPKEDCAFPLRGSQSLFWRLRAGGGPIWPSCLSDFASDAGSQSPTIATMCLSQRRFHWANAPQGSPGQVRACSSGSPVLRFRPLSKRLQSWMRAHRKHADSGLGRRRAGRRRENKSASQHFLEPPLLPISPALTRDRIS